MNVQARPAAVFATLAILMTPLSAVAQSTSTQKTAGYDNAFFIQSEDGEKRLNIGGRLQNRYHLNTTALSGNNTEVFNNFSIPRARLYFSGHVLDKKLSYKLQLAFGGGQPGNLKEFYGDYRFIQSILIARFGEWRVPFARQQINSSGKLQLVDRTSASGQFGEDFDMGVALHNNYEKSPQFEWVFGIFNGTGATPRLGPNNQFTNVPQLFDPLLAGRIGYNHGEIKGYSESDLSYGPTRFSTGFGAKSHLDIENGAQASLSGTLDFVLKSQGFATTGAAFLRTYQTGSSYLERDIRDWGGYLQGGYVINKWIGPVARFEYIDHFSSSQNTNIGLEHRYTAGLSLYLADHSIKWQNEATLRRARSSGNFNKSIIANSQLQLEF